jgi:hypothetical protein
MPLNAFPQNPPAQNIKAFDYSAPGEVFMTHARKHPLTYKRFPTAAEAIRFAIEEFPQNLLIGVVLEVDEERFDHRAIRALYEGAAYPLKRKPATN